MDTHRLRQFCVIAETSSLTKAASLLHITHSGLSKAMKLLQEELGCVLLQPSGRGLTLTEEGKRIYQNAKELLAKEEELFGKKGKPEERPVRIGTVEIFLKPLCEHLHTLNINAHSFSMLDLNPGQIEQLINDSQLDYGITYAPYPMEHITISEIASYQLGCYHLQNHFSAMDIRDIPFAVPAYGLSNNPLGIKERDGWIESATPRKKKFYVNLLSTGIELTLQGLCAIFIPKFLAHRINQNLRAGNPLIEHPLPDTQKNAQRVFLIKRKHQPDDPLYHALTQIISRFTLL